MSPGQNECQRHWSRLFRIPIIPPRRVVWTQFCIIPSSSFCSPNLPEASRRKSYSWSFSSFWRTTRVSRECFFPISKLNQSFVSEGEAFQNHTAQNEWEVARQYDENDFIFGSFGWTESPLSRFDRMTEATFSSDSLRFQGSKLRILLLKAVANASIYVLVIAVAIVALLTFLLPF